MNEAFAAVPLAKMVKVHNPDLVPSKLSRVLFDSGHSHTWNYYYLCCEWWRTELSDYCWCFSFVNLRDCMLPEFNRAKRTRGCKVFVFDSE
jgi:hypothetical protein